MTPERTAGTAGSRRNRMASTSEDRSSTSYNANTDWSAHIRERSAFQERLAPIMHLRGGSSQRHCSVCRTGTGAFLSSQGILKDWRFLATTDTRHSKFF